MKIGGSGAQDHPLLQSEFQASLGFRKPCLRIYGGDVAQLVEDPAQCI